ncbi:MAG: hypothetical protein JJV93_00070 [Alphaproteobacteria bacterium]|nr:hypothetical protein [Alphaproteobacteria bacterium]MBL0717651.1 hypothetical protein [Alphaproteobacteria bacterium]
MFAYFYRFLIFIILVVVFGGDICARRLVEQHSTLRCKGPYALQRITVDYDKIGGLGKEDIQKLEMHKCSPIWCLDLERSMFMGEDETSKSGYSRDIDKNCENQNVINGICIQCFGKRIMCDGDPRGIFNRKIQKYVNTQDEKLTMEFRPTQKCFEWVYDTL